MDKYLVIFGTRPEFIKLLPVILEIKKRVLENNFVFLFTSQHPELQEDLFGHFNFKPDYALVEKDHNNSVGFSFSHILSGIQERILDIQIKHKIKMIIGQGDTTSCACAAMAAFFNEIPFGHMEAGLRTNNFKHPYPEEYFRRIISLVTKVHFAPTKKAKENLIDEGVSPQQILLTGNTIVDAIGIIRSKYYRFRENDPLNKLLVSKKNIIITCHRRENQNGRFHTLVNSIKCLAVENPIYNFVWVPHNTPFVRNQLTEESFKGQNNIFVIPPVNIMMLYHLYEYTRLIITDSGGIQEEAPTFHIPVIVIRDYTERYESVEAGYSILSKCNKEDLINAFNKMISMPKIEMINPYGDGKSSERIVDYLISYQGMEENRIQPVK